MLLSRLRQHPRAARPSPERAWTNGVSMSVPTTTSWDRHAESIVASLEPMLVASTGSRVLGSHRPLNRRCLHCRFNAPLACECSRRNVASDNAVGARYGRRDFSTPAANGATFRRCCSAPSETQFGRLLVWLGMAGYRRGFIETGCFTSSQTPNGIPRRSGSLNEPSFRYSRRSA